MSRARGLLTAFGCATVDGARSEFFCGDLAGCETSMSWPGGRPPHERRERATHGHHGSA